MDRNVGAQALKKSCGFVIETRSTLKTLAKVCEILIARETDIILLQMQKQNDMEGIIIFHCRLERDKIKFITQLIKKLQGVQKIEWMEDTRRGKAF